MMMMMMMMTEGEAVGKFPTQCYSNHSQSLGTEKHLTGADANAVTALQVGLYGVSNQVHRRCCH